MGSPFGGPIFMPALSWLHGSACLWRRGTQVAGAGDRKRGRRARVTAACHSPRLRWAMRVATMGVENAASVMQAAAEPGWLTRCGRWGGAGRMVETRACGRRTRPGPQGTKPVRPVRGLAARGEAPRKAGQRWQYLRAMYDFRALDAKRGP